MTDRQAWLADFGTDPDAGPALDELPKSQRTVYVAVELNDVPLPEHAEETGRSVEAARAALRQAREKVGGRS